MSPAEQERRARAVRRRQAAWAHHPDRGGDPAAFIRALAEADRTASPPPPEQVIEVVAAPGFGRRFRVLAHHSRTTWAEVARRLPRSVPGARRYVDL